MPLLALTGATVYPDPAAQPVPDAVVLVEDGTISAVDRRAALPVPEQARALDCTGCTITAGFWNSHVHLFQRKWADAATLPADELADQLRDMFTRFGFTEVFDLSSPWHNTRTLRDRVESGEVPGPRIRSTGPPLVAPEAFPPDLVLETLGFLVAPAPSVADAAQAAEAAGRLLDDGVDAIKLHLQVPAGHPPFPAGAIPAAVDRAHRYGKPAFLHPNDPGDILAAVRGGVDVLAHTTPRSGVWDEPLLAAMRERDVAVTPTLTVFPWIYRHERISLRRRLIEGGVGQLRAWHEAGGTVLFGTDVGAVEYDPGPEYALMGEAGLGFRDILATLTTAPAGRLGDRAAGRVAVGLPADLVVLAGDPVRDLGGLTAVAYTLRAGQVIYRASG